MFLEEEKKLRSFLVMFVFSPFKHGFKNCV